MHGSAGASTDLGAQNNEQCRGVTIVCRFSEGALNTFGNFMAINCTHTEPVMS